MLGTCAPHTLETSAVHGMGLAFKETVGGYGIFMTTRMRGRT